MSEREIIEKRLTKKEQEISGFEEKIREAKVYVKALRDVLKALDGDSSQRKDDSETPTLKPGSAVAAAYEAIMEAKAPLHIDELLERIGKPVTREARSSLTGSIAAYVRKGEIFTRPAPSTFGLTELNHNEMPKTPPPPPEPPEDFGGEDYNLDDEIPF